MVLLVESQCNVLTLRYLQTLAEDFRTRFPKCNHLYVISKDHPQTSGAGASRLSIADITTVQHSPAHSPGTDYMKVTIATHIPTIVTYITTDYIKVAVATHIATIAAYITICYAKVTIATYIATIATHIVTMATYMATHYAKVTMATYITTVATHISTNSIHNSRLHQGNHNNTHSLHSNSKIDLI